MNVNDSAFSKSYTGPRKDIQRLIPQNALNILDVGCATGSLGSAIKEKTGACVYGVELCSEMASEAGKRLDYVSVGDAKEVLATDSFKGTKFDAIIFADVLEHLVDPWKTLELCKQHLSDNGVVITSLPNIRHIDTIYNLVIKGKWPYRDRGIHDSTHLRFFTLKNMKELFDDSGFDFQIMDVNFRLLEKPNKINRYARYVALPGIRQFLAFQYLFKATPKKI